MKPFKLFLLFAFTIVLWFSECKTFTAEPATKPPGIANTNRPATEPDRVVRRGRVPMQPLPPTPLNFQGAPAAPAAPSQAVLNAASDESRGPIAPNSPRPSKARRMAPPPGIAGGPLVPLPAAEPAVQAASVAPAPSGLEARLAATREQMVTEQLAAPGRGIVKADVLAAMRKVPRHNFIPYRNLGEAYADQPVDIGNQRTLEQPFVIASVAEQMDATPTDRILEVGTGSGYQAAVLSHLVREVYSVEGDVVMAHRAQTDLRRMGYTNNVFVRHGELADGWPEAGPFDAIILNDGLEEVPPSLLAQLKEGGRVVIPVAGDGKLYQSRKSSGRLVRQKSKIARPASPVAQQGLIRAASQPEPAAERIRIKPRQP